MKLTTKIHKNKTYDLIIKIVIVAGTYYFLYKQLFENQKAEDLYRNFVAILHHKNIYILLTWVLILMIVNWGIESMKWQFLISKIENVPLLKCFEAVMTGVSVSMMTPNRTGEYLGRVFILDRASPLKGVFITIIGSMSQLLITIIMGALAMAFFIPLYLKDFVLLSGFGYYIAIGLIFIFIAALILVFVNVSLLPSFIRRFIKRRMMKIYEAFSVISYYTSFELVLVVLYSFLRYIVFTLQFYILLLMFNVDIPFFQGMILIPIIFFVLTAIPSITLAELGIRGSVSIYFITLYFDTFSTMTNQLSMGVIATSTSLWVINLVIPAFLGTFFIYKLHFFKKREN